MENNTNFNAPNPTPPPPLQPPPISSAPPPILVAPPPPPRKSGGSGWKIFAIILLLALFASVALNLAHMAGSMLNGTSIGAQSGEKFHEVVVENEHAKDKIAILEVKGMISSEPWSHSGKTMAAGIDDQLKEAAEDDAVKAVILKVDSPGGEVMASDDIATSIRKFQEKHKKPVIASMGSLAASGGYYVSAPCQYIVANELTLTGSIGVILHAMNYRGLLDKVGVEPVTFKSGRFKDMLSGTKKPEEQDPAEKQMIQDMIMETYNKFKQVVADGRGRAEKLNKGKGKALAKNWADLADGRVLTGKQALENGFIDQLGNFEAAVDSAKQIAGISGDAKLIRYEEPFDFTSLFSLFGKSDAKKLKIDVGFDLPKIEAGRPYFLSPTFVN
jgi:protease-4